MTVKNSSYRTEKAAKNAGVSTTLEAELLAEA
jgi:hypothetical protein